MSTEKPFYILAIDGGGIRGVFAARILACLQQRLGINACFSMLAGTSTGSIIVAGLAAGLKPSEILRLYQEHGKVIFTSRFNLPRYVSQAASLLFSPYDNETLAAVLEQALGNIRLNEISTPLIIPATDIGNSKVHIFKTGQEVLLREAVLASCCAPTYFDPVRIGAELLADGGLWANNPALLAVIEAHKLIGAPLPNIRVLSLGSGHFSYGPKSGPGWGVLTQWGGLKMLDFLVSVQSQSIDNHLSLLLPAEQVLRINFATSDGPALDDYQAMDRLIACADEQFSAHGQAIADFLRV